MNATVHPIDPALRADQRDEEFAARLGDGRGEPEVPRQESASKPGPRSIVTFTRFDAVQTKPLEAVVEGVLYADTLAAIVGASGSCKSFLALSLAACIATGTTWHGCEVVTGPVFYLGGEGQSGLRKRLAGWSRHHGVDLAGAPLYIADGLPALAEQLNSAGVIAEIEATVAAMERDAGPPRLIVIDTYARAMAGADENSAADVGRIVQGLDWMRTAWRCCVLVVHHTGHGETTSSRARGSSAFYAALDSELLVKSDGGPVTVKTTKAKDWEPAGDLFLDRDVVELEIDGQAETTLVLVTGAPPAGTSAADIRANIRQLKAEGMSIRGIAGATGLHRSTVERHIRAMEREASIYREASDGE